MDAQGSWDRIGSVPRPAEAGDREFRAAGDVRHYFQSSGGRSQSLDLSATPVG
jgi:hypothetical protein